MNRRSTPDPNALPGEPGPEAPAAPVAPVTGVASGGLGTGANLEETQVLRTTDLEAFEAAHPEVASTLAPPEVPAAAAEPRAPAAAGAEPASAEAARAASVAPVPVQAPSERVVAAPISPVVASRRPRSLLQPGRGLAGVLAVALVVLAGLAILTTNGNGLAGVGGAPPQAGSTPTAEPATDKPEKGGDKGNGNGKGRGH